MAFNTRSVELPGHITLPYVEHGDPEGIPLLLLHGYTGSWRAFELVLPHLPPSVRAFAVTQRGHGEASRPATGYRTTDFASDVTAFMDALGLEAAVLAGGSSGGIVARRVAIEHPQRTRGLVFLGSPDTLRDNAGVQRMWDETISTLTDPVDPAFVREFLESTVDRPVPPPWMEAMIQESLKVPAHVWRATLEGLVEDDSFARLGQISAPTLVVWGDRDGFLTRASQEALVEAIPDARLLVYPGAGHVFYWEEPDRVAADLATFIDQLVAATAS